MTDPTDFRSSLLIQNKQTDRQSKDKPMVAKKTSLNKIQKFNQQSIENTIQRQEQRDIRIQIQNSNRQQNYQKVSIEQIEKTRKRVQQKIQKEGIQLKIEKQEIEKTHKRVQEKIQNERIQLKIEKQEIEKTHKRVQQKIQKEGIQLKIEKQEIEKTRKRVQEKIQNEDWETIRQKFQPEYQTQAFDRIKKGMNYCFKNQFIQTNMKNQWNKNSFMHLNQQSSFSRQQSNSSKRKISEKSLINTGQKYPEQLSKLSKQSSDCLPDQENSNEKELTLKIKESDRQIRNSSSLSLPSNSLLKNRHLITERYPSKQIQKSLSNKQNQSFDLESFKSIKKTNLFKKAKKNK